MTPTLLEHTIQPDDTLVFLHIPKTAGITLRAYLDAMWHPGARCPLYFPRQLQGVVPQSLDPYRSFIGHFNFAELEYLLRAPFLCITVLREPTARYLSDFLHLKYKPVIQATPQARAEIVQVRDMSLQEFITRDDLTITRRLPNLQSRILGAPLDPRSLPASRAEPYFGQLDTNALDPEIAKSRLAAINGFGLTERLQESLFLFSFLFGWRPIVDAQTLNPKAAQARDETPDPATRNKLETLNQTDIDLYSYGVKLFEERYAEMTQLLLERYGARAHARLRPPLPHEAMIQLLELHYQARYAGAPPAQIPASTSARRFTFDQTLSGVVGWHAREVSERDGVYCWTGPARTASLDLPRVGDRDIEVRFRVLYALQPHIMERVQLTANGAPVSLTRAADPAGAQIYRGIIPRSAVEHAPYLRLEWTVPETLSPADLNPASPDTRRLGLALHWIELRPT